MRDPKSRDRQGAGYAFADQVKPATENQAMTKDALGTSRRVLTITAGNIKNKHLYVTKLLDILPPDCIGAAKKTSKVGKEIEIVLDGLNEVVSTDVCVDNKSGRPRFFRKRDCSLFSS